MTPFFALTILMMPVALGYCLIALMDTKKTIPATLGLALAYGLGTGLLTLWMFLVGVLHAPFTIATINYPLATFIAICALSILKSRDATNNKKLEWILPSRHFDCLSLIFLSFILLQTGYVFWRAFNVPTSTWDAFATHAFNAKVLFYEQSLKYFNNLPHNNYPLHVPLLQAWVALNIGKWDDQLIQSIFPFYFLGTLFVQYHFLKSHRSTRWALLGIVFLVSSPFLIYHATIGYRDFTLLYYNYTTIVLLLFWRRKKEDVYLILASLFAGIASFVKLEGTGYLFIHTLLLIAILAHDHTLAMIEKLKVLLKFFMPSLGICLFFHIYRYLAMAGTTPHDDLSFNLYALQLNLTADYAQKLGVVLQKIVYNLFFSNNWNIIWLILMVSSFRLKRKTIPFEIKILFLALILFTGIYVFGYTITQYYYWVAQTETVLSRCILHIFPISTALIILINFPEKA